MSNSGCLWQVIRGRSHVLKRASSGSHPEPDGRPGAPSNMTNLLLADLLQAWIVGVLYGINLVLAILCVHKLAPQRKQFRVSQTLFFTICLLVATTTVHAALAIADLILGFTNADSPLLYFIDAGRPLVLGVQIIYTVNINVGDAFMAWRAYVWSHRSKMLAAFYIFLITANIGISIVSIVLFAHSKTLSGRTVYAWVTTAWVVSIAIQLSGSVVIGWQIASTPVAAPSTHRWDPRILVWVVIESGAIYTVLAILALALSFPDEIASYSLTYVLAQIPALVVFTITLRECWKTETELAREQVNATSTFLINERMYSRRSSLSMTGHRRSSDQVAVDVLTTTRLEHMIVDEDAKGVPGVTPVPPLSQWA
ncbi:hypothetical protein PENSPDRAFT_751106 [Peniophora sp. CONT]|nr:hypothetical protein PENSPDRAFT_751106 [Peniophora sp. CONT]